MRSLNDWKGNSICTLLALLIGKEVLPCGNDEIVWLLNSKGSFTVKSFCSTQYAAFDGWNFAASPFGSVKLPQEHFFGFSLGGHQR